MLLFRIATELYAQDLSGRGAQLYGGRWTPKGMAAVYAAESASQALLEYLPHFPEACTPPDLMLVTIEVSDALSITQLSEEVLPTDWNALPWPESTAETGREWLARKSTAALRVPSVMFPFAVAWNMVLNPLHPECRGIGIVDSVPLALDSRLIQRLRKK